MESITTFNVTLLKTIIDKYSCIVTANSTEDALIIAEQQLKDGTAIVSFQERLPDKNDFSMFIVDSAEKIKSSNSVNLNLVPQIHKVQKQISAITIKNTTEIKKLKDARDTMIQNNMLNFATEIDSKIKNVTEEFDNQLQNLNNRLAELREANTVCENCEGEGKVLRSRACAEDDRPNPDDPRDWRTCKHCKVTGKAHR